MKNLARSLVVASALTFGGTASADWFDCFCPFIGIDYYQVLGEYALARNLGIFTRDSSLTLGMTDGYIISSSRFH